MSERSLLVLYRTLPSNPDEDVLHFSPSPAKASFSKKEDYGYQPLSLMPSGDSTENAFYIQDQDGWNPEKCYLHIEQDFYLQQLPYLFENKVCPENAVAMEGDTLGIVAEWWSSASDLRGYSKIVSFSYDETDSVEQRALHFSCDFAPGSLKGTLRVRYYLYLVQAEAKRKKGYAKRPGTRLGQIGPILSVTIDGDGSAFPVRYIRDASQPLWSTYFSINDYDEPFNEDCFRLQINKDHPDYGKLFMQRNKQQVHSPFFWEIVAGAMEELFLYLKMEDNMLHDIMELDADEVEPGSVADAVRLLQSTLMESRPESITAIHQSLRQGIAKVLRGGIQE